MEGSISHSEKQEEQQRPVLYWMSMLPWNIACFGFFSSWQYLLYGLDVKIEEREMEISDITNLIVFVVSYLVKNAFSNNVLCRV